jgi:predicted membrane protein
MFCPRCGAEAGNARFCRSCGTNLDVVSNILEVGKSSHRQTVGFGNATSLNLFHSSRLFNDRDLNGHTSVSVFGGAEIDLTIAPLALGDTKMTVISIFSGAEIFVPEDVAVRVTGVSIFGGVKVRGHDLSGGIFGVNDYETPGYAQAARRLHIDVTCVFGGAKIKNR